MQNFIERLCAAVLATDGGNPETRLEIGRTIADTVAVAAAGDSEPVARASFSAYQGPGPRAWNGETVESPEAAVMLNAIAAHALDFDDVYLDSSAHTSTVIVPAALAIDGKDEADVVAACGAGLIAARAVGTLLGREHYKKGWHGTGTVGVFSATAAAAHIAGLSSGQLRCAFGLAGAMAGGLQRNFSTMAKPAHAGFAASAGVRAVRLAAQGVTAADDIFGPRGIPDLYGMGAQEVDDDAFAIRCDRVAVKLYPCCYATHRFVGAALDMRAVVGALAKDAQIVLTTPQGSLSVLKYDRPTDGLQAKFSAPFTTAAALLDGPLLIEHFSEDALHRQDIRDCMERLTVVEDATQPSHGSIEDGVVRLEIFEGGMRKHIVERRALPGSDKDPVTWEQLAAKAAGCFALFRKEAGRDFPMVARIRAIPEAAYWLGTA